MTDVTNQQQETTGFQQMKNGNESGNGYPGAAPQVPYVQYVPQFQQGPHGTVVVIVSSGNAVYPTYPQPVPQFPQNENYLLKKIYDYIDKKIEENENSFGKLVSRLENGEEIQVIDELGKVKTIKMVKDSSIT
jgi:hypothetical protein